MQFNRWSPPFAAQHPLPTLPGPRPPSQFVLFQACRQSPEHCCRAFLHLLISRLTDRQQPPITRSACAAYAASFLARCVEARNLEVKGL